jgi:hypothetical protein
VGTPARLKYHRTAFELLGREPVVSEEAVRLTEEAERHCGRRLAASVREWYSLRDAVALLPRHYHPRPLESVLNNFLSEGRIALGFDGGGSEWFVKPNGSDDPPVVVDEWFGDPADGERPFADRFSVLLFSWVWDGVTSEAWRSPIGFAVQALNTGFGPMELDFLKDQFQEAETPRWEGGQAWYFFTAGQRVMAFRNSPRLGLEVTSWYLTADSAADLASLLRQLWPCLVRVKDVRSQSQSSRAVLEQVRRECGSPPAPK